MYDAAINDNTKNLSMSKRKLIIDKTRCKFCRLCIEACPKHCLEADDVRNEAGYLTVKLKEGICNACGICVRTCPEPWALRFSEAEAEDVEALDNGTPNKDGGE